jgi:hypothetical protein
MPDWSEFVQNARSKGILIDANLFVLFIVGSVNRRRITKFKRTSKYTPQDYDILAELVGQVSVWYTVPHVLAEVSNLTDLGGNELSAARALLRDTIHKTEEVLVKSREACGVECYGRLGLTDAAIDLVVRSSGCSVLTDDLDLFVTLVKAGAHAVNFNHLRGYLLN